MEGGRQALAPSALSGNQARQSFGAGRDLWEEGVLCVFCVCVCVFPWGWEAGVCSGWGVGWRVEGGPQALPPSLLCPRSAAARRIPIVLGIVGLGVWMVRLCVVVVCVEGRVG